MRAQGSIVERSTRSWSLVITTGYVVQDGKRKRKQKWVTFTPDPKKSKKQNAAAAQAELAELINDHNKGTYVDPSKLTLIDWLNTWLEKSVKPPMRRPETYRTYGSIIKTHIAASPIALITLQRLRGADLERYYADSKAAPASLSVHHALLHRALKKAVKDKLLTVNPAVDLERRRAAADPGKAAREHCWSAVEARRVIETAKTAGPQMAAFMFLALDSGARKSELDGLGWEHLNPETGMLTIERQLDRAGAAPVFGPTKTKHVRSFALNPETLAALRVHRQAQAALKMRNRTSYADFGLIFAKEDGDLQTPEAKLGQPLNRLSENRFQALVKEAGVKRIKFHGVRHTVATLSLQAGTLPHVVAARLGHSVMELMKTYAHALPNQQQDAAARLGALLHG